MTDCYSNLLLVLTSALFSETFSDDYTYVGIRIHSLSVDEKHACMRAYVGTNDDVLSPSVSNQACTVSTIGCISGAQMT